MHREAKPFNSIFGFAWNSLLPPMIVLLVLLSAFTTQPVQGQTYRVIYNFTGGLDGGTPRGGLTIDPAGNLYGTTCGAPCDGVFQNNGTVFKLSRNGAAWVYTRLYAFHGDVDGAGPTGRVIFGPDGAMYGTTVAGGTSGSGTVFRLTASPSIPASAFGGWTESILYSFRGGDDGASPTFGDLLFDYAGNIYGTTAAGGRSNAGTVFKLTKSPDGWNENTLYSFTGGQDGSAPSGAVAFDNAGNLYGTAWQGGSGCGTVFKLTPSGSGWTESTMYTFHGSEDGCSPLGGVMIDSGAVIATTTSGGLNGGGTALWVGNNLFTYGFQGGGVSGPYSAPTGSVTNLYGTTFMDGTHQKGSVYNLTGCAGWGYTSLHDFAGGADGAYPMSNIVVDAAEHLFGTTTSWGAHGQGLVFEIGPAESSRDTRLANCSRNHE